MGIIALSGRHIAEWPQSPGGQCMETIELPTVTNTSLLMGLRDAQNDCVWTEFCARYIPVLESFGRRRGLGEHDAEDAAQETLAAFAEAYRQGKYDRDRGRLRTWLLAIAKHRIADAFRKRGKQIARGGDADTTDWVDALPDEHTMSSMWEAEWRRAIVRRCMEEVRCEVQPVTMQAFELFALREWPAEKVANHLGISVNSVFLAKSRVLARMRRLEHQLEETW